VRRDQIMDMIRCESSKKDGLSDVSHIHRLRKTFLFLLPVFNRAYNPPKMLKSSSDIYH
jgi:hypothetical protein